MLVHIDKGFGDAVVAAEKHVVVSADSSDHLFLHNMPELEELGCLRLDDVDTITCVDVDSQCTMAALGTETRDVKIVKIPPLRKLESTLDELDMEEFANKATRFNSFVRHVQFSPDAKTLLCCADEADMKLIKLAPSPLDFEVKVLSGHTGGVLCGVFHSNGRYIASVGTDGLLIIHTVSEEGKWEVVYKEVHFDRGTVDMKKKMRISWHPDHLLVALPGREQVRFVGCVKGEWKTFTQEERHKRCIELCAFHPSAPYMATSDVHEQVLLWDVSFDGEGPPAMIRDADFSLCAPDGKPQEELSSMSIAWTDTAKLCLLVHRQKGELYLWTPHGDPDEFVPEPEPEPAESARPRPTLKSSPVTDGSNTGKTEPLSESVDLFADEESSDDDLRTPLRRKLRKKDSKRSSLPRQSPSSSPPQPVPPVSTPEPVNPFTAPPRRKDRKTPVIDHHMSKLSPDARLEPTSTGVNKPSADKPKPTHFTPLVVKKEFTGDKMQVSPEQPTQSTKPAPKPTSSPNAFVDDAAMDDGGSDEEEAAPVRREDMDFIDDRLRFEDAGSMVRHRGPSKRELSKMMSTTIASHLPRPQKKVHFRTTPLDENKRRILVWNNVGCAVCREENSRDLVEVTFADNTRYRSLKLVDTRGWSMAALSPTGLILAAPSHSNLPSQVFYHPINCWVTRNSEWTHSLSPGDEMVAVACGGGTGEQKLSDCPSWAAVCTSSRTLRGFSSGGVQNMLFSMPGDVLYMAGGGRWLAVAYHGSMAERSGQNLYVRVYDMRMRKAVLTTRVCLSPGAELEWMDYSEEGSLFTTDSTHRMRVFDASHNEWVPLMNLRSLPEIKGDHVWPVAVGGEQFLCAMLKEGQVFPSSSPLPVLQSFPVTLDVLSPFSKAAPHEQLYIRSQVFTSEERKDNNKVLDLALFELFGLAMNAEQYARAYDIAIAMATKRVFRATLTVVAAHRQEALGKKLADWMLFRFNHKVKPPTGRFESAPIDSSEAATPTPSSPRKRIRDDSEASTTGSPSQRSSMFGLRRGPSSTPLSAARNTSAAPPDYQPPPKRSKRGSNPFAQSLKQQRAQQQQQQPEQTDKPNRTIFSLN